MRALQLIDSLQPGGAERVAVNIANALESYIDKSFLCATRSEGELKNNISKNVEYLFLQKKHTIDIKAVKRLRKFIQENEIDIIHAHSSSFFLATIVKLLNRKIKLVWHDHYGNSEFLSKRKSIVLKFLSRYFDFVICVNKSLENWAKNYLKFNSVKYLQNFAVVNYKDSETQLSGEPSKRIVCLANLRPQKDHLTLIRAFKKIVADFPEWTLHLVGKDFNDDYSKMIKTEISKLELSKFIITYGSRQDVFEILKQCDIGILSSKSEGLPVALLEYGLSSLAVITTNVGECDSVIGGKSNGIVVSPENSEEMYKGIKFLIENKPTRIEMAKSFNKRVQKNFSQDAFVKEIKIIYNHIIEVA